MTKRDFFVLIIKLFGLTCIITSLFSVIPSNIGFAIVNMDVFSVVWIIFAIIFTIGLFTLLVFKADKVVHLLKLDKGFDDDRIELGKFSAADVVKIGAFIIGGELILYNIPGFLSHTLFAFKGSVAGHSYDAEDNFNWVVSGVKLIVGYLLLTNYKYVAKLFRASKQKDDL